MLNFKGKSRENRTIGQFDGIRWNHRIIDLIVSVYICILHIEFWTVINSRFCTFIARTVSAFKSRVFIHDSFAQWLEKCLQQGDCVLPVI